MARKKDDVQTEASETSNGTARKKSFAEFRLMADRIEDGTPIMLAKVKGTTAAKAVFALALNHLADKFNNFRCEMSTIKVFSL